MTTQNARQAPTAALKSSPAHTSHFVMNLARFRRTPPRSLLTIMEQDYARLSEQLGCTWNENIITIVQSRDQYQLGSSPAEWSGGYYDGRIHLSSSGGIDPKIERASAHELVHACLASIPSGATPWPAWLQEGLAQRFSGDTLQPSDREELSQLVSAHRMPDLEHLATDWFCLPRQGAVAAYNIALAAADSLGDHEIRELLSAPQKPARLHPYPQQKTKSASVRRIKFAS